MSDHRDVDLGNALQALPTPDHRPGFWEDLEDQLALEAPAPDRRPGRRSRSFPRRLFPGPGILAVAAAAALVVAVVAVRLPDSERGATRVATDPPTTVPATPELRWRPGPERSLGEGLVAGVSADGSAALVVAEDPGSNTSGCEGTGARTLFASPLDGGDRRHAVPGGDPVAGTVVRDPTDPTRVAIVSVCEEFLSDLVVAREGSGGALAELIAVDRDVLGDLVGRFTWARDGSALLGMVSGSGDVVRVDAATGTREPVLTGAGAVQVGELADGSLAVLTRDQRLRLGDVEHTVAALGIAVSPDGTQVAAFGDGVWLFAPGQAPRQLTTGPATHATWAPDGRALAVTGQGTYPDGGALSVVTLDGALSVITTTGVVGAGHLSPDGRALAFTRIGPAPAGAGETGEVVERAVVVRFG